MSASQSVLEFFLKKGGSSAPFEPPLATGLNTTDAQLVYSGITAGEGYGYTGGGVNYLCLPKEPEYLGSKSNCYTGYLYGTEYQNPIMSTISSDQNVPCAVCYTSTKSVQIIKLHVLIHGLQNMSDTS